MTKLNLKSGLLIILIITIIAFGGLSLFKSITVTKPTESIEVDCGGWDTFGGIVCDCLGSVKKFVCPSGTVCDSGTDTCSGVCGECKCFIGPSSDGTEIPCNGKDKFFK